MLDSWGVSAIDDRGEDMHVGAFECVACMHCPQGHIPARHSFVLLLIRPASFRTCTCFDQSPPPPLLCGPNTHCAI
jgi:hypothetical protein